MSTCCIALGEPAQIRGSISKMKMDIQKKKWTVIRQKMHMYPSVCLNMHMYVPFRVHVQTDRQTDRNMNTHVLTDRQTDIIY